MHNDDEDGIGAEELAELDRQAFRRALEVARSRHEPGREWDDFVFEAWNQAAPVFRLEPAHER